jgi:hypothetical protein
MNYTFNNSSIVSVNSGTIVLNVSGKTRTFVDAKLVSAVDGKIVLDLPQPVKENGSYLVIHIGGRVERIFITNHYRKCCIDYYVSQRDDTIVYNQHWVYGSPIRNATPEEIQELNDQLADESKQWNPDTMQIEKLRWKPTKGTKYFHVFINGGEAQVSFYYWKGDLIDRAFYEMGNCFKTREEAGAKLEQIKKLFLEV